MLTPRSSRMLRTLGMQSTMNSDFQQFRNLAFSSGYFAFVGCLIFCLSLWMWLWHNTHFQDTTVFKISGGILAVFSFYLYTHIRRGFGSFFIIAVIAGFIAICTPSSSLSAFTSNPFGSISVFINLGLFVYGFRAHSIRGIIINAILTLAIICTFWFNPQLVSPWILGLTGISLMFSACICRYFVFLNSYY